MTTMKMPKKFGLGIAQFVFGMVAIGFSNTAEALTCDEIISMVGYDLPTDVIVNTVKGSGTRFSAEEIQCLVDQGAPQAVIEQAKRMSQQQSSPVELPEEDEPERIDDEDDVEIRNVRGEDLSEDGDANDPREIKHAIKLIRAQKPIEASYRLFSLLSEGKYPEFESKIHYYLARALSDFEMYHSAQYYYLQVIKRGPADPYFNYALPKMVALARFTDDDTDLARIAKQLPPERYPRQAKNHLHYLLGVQEYNKGELAAARGNFEKISSKSAFYLPSRYVEGVIFNEQEKYKSAVRAFRDVYREEVEVYNDPREIRKINDLRDLSLINIASIYYGIGRYEESTSYYQKVSRKSQYWAESMFRDAWSNLHLGQLNVTLGKVLTVESPYFIDTDFIPEAKILKALTYFQLCEYNRVEKIINEFDSTYQPMKAEITSFLADYETKEQRRLADQAWNRYFGTDVDGNTVLPQSFFSRLLKNQDLAGIVRHLEMMDEEMRRIDSEKPQWRDTVGVHLKKVIEKDRLTYERRAGRMLLAEMQRQSEMLAALLSQSQIIGFEVVDAQRLDYEYKASNLEALADQSKFDVDFATSPDLIYWPFNGEFWADELGYYNYTEQSSCQ
jgi:tetratricopeptide (TPR) repeat protein